MRENQEKSYKSRKIRTNVVKKDPPPCAISTVHFRTGYKKQLKVQSEELSLTPSLTKLSSFKNMLFQQKAEPHCPPALYYLIIQNKEYHTMYLHAFAYSIIGA